MPTFVIVNFEDLESDKVQSSKPRLCINERTIRGFLTDFRNMANEKLTIDETTDSRACYGTFLTEFKGMYDKWFLHANNKKCKHVHLKSDWITIGLAKSCEVRNKLYFKWRKSRTKNNWNVYMEYKRRLDRLLDKTRYDYYNKEFSNCIGDLKQTWTCINKILGRKRRSQLLTFKNVDASHNFNKYFASIAHTLLADRYSENGTNSNENEFEKYLHPTVEDSMSDDPDPFTGADIEYFIKKLNNNKSTYYSPRVLKCITKDICPLLAKLYNKCYLDGYFPDELKLAKVIPLYKNKGKRGDIGNYRPKFHVIDFF